MARDDGGKVRQCCVGSGIELRWNVANRVEEGVESSVVHDVEDVQKEKAPSRLKLKHLFLTNLNREVREYGDAGSRKAERIDAAKLTKGAEEIHLLGWKRRQLLEGVDDCKASPASTALAILLCIDVPARKCEV